MQPPTAAVRRAEDSREAGGECMQAHPTHTETDMHTRQPNLLSLSLSLSLVLRSAGCLLVDVTVGLPALTGPGTGSSLSELQELVKIAVH